MRSPLTTLLAKASTLTFSVLLVAGAIGCGSDQTPAPSAPAAQAQQTNPAHQNSSDPIVQQLNRAITEYQSGNINEVEVIMSKTLTDLKNERKNQLFAYFPDAPDGFSQEPIETKPLPEFMVGLGQQADMRYTASTGNARVTLSILLDSPLNAQYQAIISNPSQIQNNPGIEPIQVNEFQGLHRSDEARNSQEMTIVLNEKLMIIGRGDAVDRETLESFVAGIDVGRLMNDF